jgi:hypothetical protein
LPDKGAQYVTHHPLGERAVRHIVGTPIPALNERGKWVQTTALSPHSQSRCRIRTQACGIGQGPMSRRTIDTEGYTHSA